MIANTFAVNTHTYIVCKAAARPATLYKLSNKELGELQECRFR